MRRNRFAAFVLAVALVASNVATAQNKASQSSQKPGSGAHASAGQMNGGVLPPIKFTEFRL
ncbi:MAG TPA: hypothetical protein VGB05_01520, partial [Pyrinomonadaceae bacterium]